MPIFTNKIKKIGEFLGGVIKSLPLKKKGGSEDIPPESEIPCMESQPTDELLITPEIAHRILGTFLGIFLGILIGLILVIFIAVSGGDIFSTVFAVFALLLLLFGILFLCYTLGKNYYENYEWKRINVNKTMKYTFLFGFIVFGMLFVLYYMLGLFGLVGTFLIFLAYLSRYTPEKIEGYIEGYVPEDLISTYRYYYYRMNDLIDKKPADKKIFIYELMRRSFFLLSFAIVLYMLYAFLSYNISTHMAINIGSFLALFYCFLTYKYFTNLIDKTKKLYTSSDSITLQLEELGVDSKGVLCKYKDSSQLLAITQDSLLWFLDTANKLFTFPLNEIDKYKCVPRGILNCDLLIISRRGDEKLHKFLLKRDSASRGFIGSFLKAMENRKPEKTPSLFKAVKSTSGKIKDYIKGKFDDGAALVFDAFVDKKIGGPLGEVIKEHVPNNAKRKIVTAATKEGVKEQWEKLFKE